MHLASCTCALEYFSPWGEGGSPKGRTAIINLEKNLPILRKHDDFSNNKAKPHKIIKHDNGCHPHSPGEGGWVVVMVMVMVTLFIHRKSFSKDYKEIKDKI